MSWRDFQMPQDIKEVVCQDSHPVQKDQKVQKEKAEVLLNGHFVHIVPGSVIENGREYATDRGKSAQESARLYREGKQVDGNSAYTPSEVDALKDLSLGERIIMHEAKQIFGGVISKVD